MKFQIRSRAWAYEWWYLKAKQRRVHIFAIAALLSFLFIVCVTSALNRSTGRCNFKKSCSCDLIVPDIIHFYRGDREAKNISNKEAACIRAALRLHGTVWLHTTNPQKSKLALQAVGLESENIRVMYPPRGPGPIHLAILSNYGGIFLKNDIYMVDRLDAMRGHDLCSVGQNDIVAGTKDGALNGFEVKLKGVLLDQDYGALYITDIIKNCTYSAVRLEVR